MVRRTCLDCGETRTLEAGLAHLRARPPRGRSARFLGGPLVGRYGVQQQAEQLAAEAEAGLEQELETVRQARTCPKCGGERYKDQRI